MVERSARANTEPLAVIGMNILSLACDGLQTFEELLYNRLEWFSGENRQALAESGQVGGTQKSSLLRVAEGIRGVNDALKPVGDPGVCYWISSGSPGADLAGQGLASNELVVELSGQTNPLLAAVVQAKKWLTEGKCQTVLLACSDGADLAAAILIQPLADARNAHRPVFAILADVLPAADSHDFAQTLPNAGVAAKDVGYLELSECCASQNPADPIEGLARVFSGEINDLTTVLRMNPDQVEKTPLDSMAALIRIGLCLYHRFLPAAPHQLDAAIIEELVETGFYMLEEPRPWLLKRTQAKRQAGLYQTGPNGAFWLFAEDILQKERPNAALSRAEYRLFPLAANTVEELTGMLKLLRIQAEKDPNLVALSKKWFAVYQKRPAAILGLMLTGSTQAELLREIEFAQKGVPDAIHKGSDWQTPSGSYFAPLPLGQKGSVCLVYPGAFNSYVGIGRDLFHLFPQINEWMDTLAEDLAYVFCDHYLYPRSLGPISKEELAALENALTDDAVAMMTSGMAFSVVYTYILERIFKVSVESALGYSLGEMSMLFATGVWVDGDRASEALARSPLFSDRLAGPLNAVREAWGMPPQPEGRSEDLWANHVLMAAPERVLEAIKGEKRVYMTHTNTPRQVVIAGEKNDCQRVIQALKCASLKAPFSYALHCEAMKSEYERLRQLNVHPIRNWPAIRLYSAAGYGLFKPEPENIAHEVAISLCAHLDFPRLVQRAYADGARIFIEVGAGGNCAKWIDDSMRGQPCLTMSVNRKGMDDATALVRTLAKLASHRAPVDLAPLYA